MKKMMCVVLSTLLVSLALVGCSSSSSDGKESASSNSSNSSNSSSSDSTKKITLTLWTLNTHLFVDPVVEQFKKDNPNIDVQVSKYATDALKEASKVAANSKTLPSVWFTWGGSFGSFYPENGLTADLTQVSKDHNWSEKYQQAAIDLSTFDGKVSGVPLHLNVLAMWYPKSVYQKTNLTAPKTFDEFEAQLKTLKDAGITPMTFGSKKGWQTMRLTEQLLEHFAGPELHDKLNTLTASWNDPAVVKTFEKLKEYTDKEYFPKGYVSLDPNEADALLYQEQAAYIMEGTWLDRNITKAGFDPNNYDAFTFPNSDGKSRVSSFAEMFQINKNLDEATQAAAVKLAEYMTSTDVVNNNVELYSTPAAANVKFSDKTPHIQPILDSTKNGTFMITDQALPQIVSQKLFEAQDKVALGEWTPQQAAEAMEKASADYKATKK